MKEIKLVIDNDVLDRYNKYYFGIHKRAKKLPIPHPYHESINTWFILQRPAMNALKGRWKDFIKWFVNDVGCSDMKIEKCKMKFVAYYSTNLRHDTDNSCPKFILDGLVEGGLVIDDDMNHITSLTLECGVDKSNPRTEIYVTIFDE